MLKNKRFLQKPQAYYESAMKRANSMCIFNQSTLPDDFYLQVFWCRYIHYSFQSNFKPNSKMHSHSFFELHCVLSGTMAYNEADQLPREVNAGSFILIAPQKNHFLKAVSPDAETFAVTFEPVCRDTLHGQRLRALFDALTSIDAQLNDEVYRIIELIMEEFYRAKPYCTQNIKLLLNVLVGNIIGELFENNLEYSSSPEPISETYQDSRIAEIDKYIADNPSRLFSLSELAAYLNISTRQFNNIVQNELGITAKSFVDIRKARQARKLLLETDLNLQKISEQLGFSDHNNFNRFFKRIEGMSPGIFRRSRGKHTDARISLE